MKLRFFMLSAILAGISPLAQAQIPPDVVMVNDLHCSLKDLGGKLDGPWETTAIASYANPARYHGGEPWTMVLSVRNHIGESADDCQRWMKGVRKAQHQKRFPKPEVVAPDSKKKT